MKEPVENVHHSLNCNGKECSECSIKLKSSTIASIAGRNDDANIPSPQHSIKKEDDDKNIKFLLI